MCRLHRIAPSHALIVASSTCEGRSMPRDRVFPEILQIARWTSHNLPAQGSIGHEVFATRSRSPRAVVAGGVLAGAGLVGDSIRPGTSHGNPRRAAVRR